MSSQRQQGLPTVGRQLFALLDDIEAVWEPSDGRVALEALARAKAELAPTA